MPRPTSSGAPERAAIFERDGSNIAIMLFSVLMLTLVVVAGYFLLQSQNTAPVLRGPAIVNAPVHHAPMAIRAKVEREVR